MNQYASNENIAIIYKKGSTIMRFTKPTHDILGHPLPSNALSITAAFTQNAPLASCTITLKDCVGKSYEYTGILFAYVERMNTEARQFPNVVSPSSLNLLLQGFIVPPAFILAFSPLQMMLQGDKVLTPDEFLTELTDALF
jgi:hypothetical protein